MKSIIDKKNNKISLSLEEKDNIDKVVNRYMRIRLKRRFRKLTGIKLR